MNKIATLNNDDDKKKRRGRKPKDKFAYDDTPIDKPDSLNENDNNIILKIPISCMEFDKDFYLEEVIPKPFDKDTLSSYSNIQPSQENTIQQDPLFYPEQNVHSFLTDLVDGNNKRQLTQVEILLEKKYKHTKQISLLTNFCTDKVNHKWPTTTNIACYWDCHCFDHTPWGIPIKYNYQTDEFTLFGVFCSPNCAMSYLIVNETNTNLLWEKISLLNFLYYKVYETDENIIPAPDKICLKLFGGSLEPYEFRALTIKNNKIYNINFPPCLIITPVLEETKKLFDQDTYFIPNDKKKHNKIQSELKIKRTRPINSNKNTLDSIILGE